MKAPKRPTPWAARQARSRYVAEAVVPGVACGIGALFALFMLSVAGQATVVTCQFRGALSECIIQDMRVGLFEDARRGAVGVDHAEVREERYQAEDDEGRKVWRTAYRLALLDVVGNEIEQIPLPNEQALRGSAHWVQSLQRPDGAMRDRYSRFWVTNPVAIGFGALLWVAMTCGGLSLMLKHRRWAYRLVYLLAVVQLAAAGSLIGVFAMCDEPPAFWPGLAQPGLLPNPEP